MRRGSPRSAARGVGIMGAGDIPDRASLTASTIAVGSTASAVVFTHFRVSRPSASTRAETPLTLCPAGIAKTSPASRTCFAKAPSSSRVEIDLIAKPGRTGRVPMRPRSAARARRLRKALGDRPEAEAAAACPDEAACRQTFEGLASALAASAGSGSALARRSARSAGRRRRRVRCQALINTTVKDAEAEAKCREAIRSGASIEEYRATVAARSILDAVEASRGRMKRGAAPLFSVIAVCTRKTRSLSTDLFHDVASHCDSFDFLCIVGLDTFDAVLGLAHALQQVESGLSRNRRADNISRVSACIVFDAQP